MHPIERADARQLGAAEMTRAQVFQRGVALRCIERRVRIDGEAFVSVRVDARLPGRTPLIELGESGSGLAADLALAQGLHLFG